jgi:hypothetical protein
MKGITKRKKQMKAEDVEELISRLISTAPSDLPQYYTADTIMTLLTSRCSDTIMTLFSHHGVLSINRCYTIWS